MTARLTPEAREVLLALPPWHAEQMPYVRDHAIDLSMPVERLRQILRSLTQQGLATYGQVASANEDGLFAGSTYWATEKGVALQQELETA